MRNRQMLWYGLIAVSCILIGVAGCLPLITTTVFVIPMMTKLQTGASAITLYVSVSAIGGTVASAFIGKLTQKISAKLLVVVGGILTGLFYVVLGTTNQLFLIYIAAFFQGIGMIVGGMTHATIIISKWFIKAKGTMMSLIMVAMTLTGAVLIPVLAGMIESIGYEQVAIYLGIGSACVMILPGILTIVESPEKVGLHAYGYEVNVVSFQNSASTSISNLPYRAAIKTIPFWIIMFVKMIITVASQGISSNSSAYFQTLGLSSVEASIAISVMSISGLTLSLLTGVLMDKKGPAFASIVDVSLMTVAFLLSYFWSGWYGAIICALLFGASSAIGSVFAPNMLINLYGTKDSAQLVGAGNIAGNIGSFLGPIAVSALYDITGNYNIGFMIIGILCAVSVFMIRFSVGEKMRSSLHMLQTVQK